MTLADSIQSLRLRALELANEFGSVTEALNEGGAFFGDERLLGSLRQTAGRSAAQRSRTSCSGRSRPSWTRLAGTTRSRSWS